MRRVLYLLVAILLGGMAWVRLAPDDPARWHGPIADAGTAAFVQGANSARARLLLPGTDPAGVLERLDAVARAAPRTRRLAGSPGEGRITWVTRSPLLGFPDYTTAEAVTGGGATLLILHARARYGLSDAGVNALRLKDWTAKLAAP